MLSCFVCKLAGIRVGCTSQPVCVDIFIHIFICLKLCACIRAVARNLITPEKRRKPSQGYKRIVKRDAVLEISVEAPVGLGLGRGCIHLSHGQQVSQSGAQRRPGELIALGRYYTQRQDDMELGNHPFDEVRWQIPQFFRKRALTIGGYIRGLPGFRISACRSILACWVLLCLSWISLCIRMSV